MKVTLKHIAEDTGFSQSTISRAIRGEGRISEKNKAKILKSAQRLGYQIPSQTRPLPDDFPTYIALITNFRTGEFFASFIVGFQQAAINKGIEISMFSVAGGQRKATDILSECVTLGYKGAILFVPEFGRQDYEEILANAPEDFPIISCSNIDNTIIDTVTFDAYQGAILVAKHLHKQGYNKFGLIEGPSIMPESRFRTNGFNDYLVHMAHLEITWRYQGDYTLESGARAFDSFLNLEEKPEAIFAANDAMAVGFMEKARQKGYDIPNDVAVVGYDNLPICETHYPTISSVNTDYCRLGENAIESIITRLNQPIAQQGIVSLVPVSLVERGSS